MLFCSLTAPTHSPTHPVSYVALFRVLRRAFPCLPRLPAGGREMLVGADRCLGDIVSEMLSTIEDSDEPYEEAHIYLVTLFPQFAHIFSEMKQVSVATVIVAGWLGGGG